MLSKDFFERDPVTCARELIGCTLVHKGCSGIVIETEAYAESGDEACHLFTRPSARDFAAAHPAGTAYVYLNYGIHWLTNVLCHDPATGNAGFVLLRALEPTAGIEEMKERRNKDKLHALCSGPGKLSQALGIGPDHHGRSLCAGEEFVFTAGSVDYEIVSDPRIGISKAKELPWRFLLREHPGVSVPPQRQSRNMQKKQK
ncbi:MAG: DNA-3-methyladenine glycosylase [Verrucomicrobiota bacterium]